MRLRFALIFGLAAALLAGCTAQPRSVAPPAPTTPPGNGVTALAADQIFAQAKAALGAAPSYHITGIAGTKKIDQKVEGTSRQGTVDNAGVVIEVITIGTDAYIKAPDSVWKGLLPSDATVVKMLSGKWVKLDGTNASFTSLLNLVDVNQLLTVTGTLAKGDTKVVNGTPAIGLVDSGSSGILYVALEGAPYPLSIEGRPGEGGVVFTEYGTPFHIAAPPPAQVLDLKKLTG
jgi:hypothetical protein